MHSRQNTLTDCSVKCNVHCELGYVHKLSVQKLTGAIHMKLTGAIHTNICEFRRCFGGGRKHTLSVDSAVNVSWDSIIFVRLLWLTRLTC